LLREFDGVLLATGAEQPRDVEIPGRDLKGIHFAMDYLTQQNKRVADERFSPSEEIVATGKRVIIIGGGDTGADCLGTAHRQKALSVHQLQIHPMPPGDRHANTPWPMWPLQLRMEPAHEEGGVREWSVLTTHFSGDENGNVKKLHCVRVGPKPALERVTGSEFYLDADLVLIAIGFAGPVRRGFLERLPLTVDARGSIRTDGAYMTAVPGLFSAGDARRGQSLVVWAIAEGRQAAHHLDKFLMGSSQLPL
jgi:glutamate synthase (NADPH/NADH) small chain